MQAEIKIRHLTEADYATVLELWQRCDGVEVAEGDDEPSFCSYLARNPGLSLCAEADQIIVGAVLCGHDGRRGFVYHLAVAPGFRGRGIGRQLLKAGLGGLRERGIARAIILVAKDNTPGREFWLSQGFEEISQALPLGVDIL